MGHTALLLPDAQSQTIELVAEIEGALHMAKLIRLLYLFCTRISTRKHSLRRPGAQRLLTIDHSSYCSIWYQVECFHYRRTTTHHLAFAANECWWMLLLPAVDPNTLVYAIPDALKPAKWLDFR